MTPIAVTRIALRSALGNTLEETVAALRRGDVGICTPLDLEQTPSVHAGAGEVPCAASDRGVWRAETLLRKTLSDLLDADDRQSIARDPTRWGIVSGTTLSGMRHCGVGMRADEAADAANADLSFARTCASSVLAHALKDTAIEGPSITVSCACASALSAVNHACTLLAAGTVDAVIAGGYDPIAEFVYGGFAALQLVATGPLSPFSQDREGMKLGEGVAMFVLRRASDLTEDERARARGYITATAETSDAHHLTSPHPDGDGAARALLAVLTESAPAASMPDLIVAHATGTEGNDGAEHNAYRAAFGSALSSIPVVALKSRFGHPLGAAGVLEVASVIGCAEHDFIPTTAGRGVDRATFSELNLLEGAVRQGSPADIVVLSAGFGGANAATRIRRGNALHFASTPHAPRSAAATVSVTAAGCVSPAGRGINALLDRMQDPAPWPELNEEILAPLLDRARTRRMALLPRLMIAAVRDLVEQAGVSADELSATPLLAASWCGAVDFTERYYRDLVRSGIDLANPMLFAESVPNIGSAQCSLAFGIKAPSMSVVGRRTAALEALLIARARIATGEWSRAIVVASDEAHPIMTRVLARCCTRDLQFRASAIAFLLESDSNHVGGDSAAPRLRMRECGAMRGMNVADVIARTAPLSAVRAAAVLGETLSIAQGNQALCTSSSPFDDALADSLPHCQRVRVAELGAATALACALGHGRDGRGFVACSDPHGAAGAIHIG